MNRRIACLIAIVGLNLMACCCGGFAGNETNDNVAVAVAPPVVNQPPIKQDDIPVPKKKNPVVETPIPPKSNPSENPKKNPPPKSPDIPATPKENEDLKRRPVPPFEVRLPVARDFKQITKVTHEDVTIELLAGTIGRTNIKRRTVGGLTDGVIGENLNIKVRINNEGANKFKFTPWHAYKSPAEPTAKDELGGIFKHRRMQIASWPDGFQESISTISPGKPLVDLLMFSKPSFLSEEIAITLPGSNVNHPGVSFEFKIARAFFEDTGKRAVDIDNYAKDAKESHERNWNAKEDKRIAAIKEGIRVIEEARLAQIEADRRAAKAAKEMADRTQILGDIEVRIESSKYGKVSLLDEIRLGTASSEKKLVAVRVSITNRSNTKLRWYEPWGEKLFAANRSPARMNDEFGNAYPGIYFALGLHPTDQLRRKSRLDPGKTVYDSIIFDPPIDNAQEFRLTFPGANIGETKSATFSVPRAFLMGE